MNIDARRVFKRRGLLVTAVAVGVLVGGGATACGTVGDDGPSAAPAGAAAPADGTAAGAATAGAEPPSGDAPGAQPSGKRITVVEAAAAALKAVPGKVEEIELDDSVWEVEILAENGKWRDVKVHPETGEVLSNRPDDDDDDDRDEAAALRKAKVTASNAARVALKAVPGTVTAVEFDEDDGRAVWEVEIDDRNGNEREVTVHAATAKVLEVDDD